MSANDKTGVGSGTGEWETPPALFKLLHRRWQFNYDPFATKDNAKTDLFSTVNGTYRLLGRDKHRHKTYEQVSPLDGLKFDWKGLRVFANPPYTRGMLTQYVTKALTESRRADCIVYLVPAATETGWFRALMNEAKITFLPRRVAFIHPKTRCGESCWHALGEPINNPPGGMAIAEFSIPEDVYVDALTRTSPGE